jgi:hypothetical protein
MPSFETNAPQGYMGDWKRGAPMGRPSIAPDTRTVEQLQVAAAQLKSFARQAERDRENRKTPDGLKARYWFEAVHYFQEEAQATLALIPAAQARETNDRPKVTLRRVRLDSGGYDDCGAYWGQGEPLYWAATDDGRLDQTFRASDRADAKATVRETFPLATFYN